jgi:hypothetical protein
MLGRMRTEREPLIPANPVAFDFHWRPTKVDHAESVHLAAKPYLVPGITDGVLAIEPSQRSPIVVAERVECRSGVSALAISLVSL